MGDRGIAAGLLCLSTLHGGVKRAGLGSAARSRSAEVGKDVLPIGELGMKFISDGWMTSDVMLRFVQIDEDTSRYWVKNGVSIAD
jgi:hypothetical protein